MSLRCRRSSFTRKKWPEAFFFLSLFVVEIEDEFIRLISFSHGFLDFLQNRKSSNFPSVGSHSLLRLHISLLGLYSYEQHSDVSVQAFVHLERCFSFAFCILFMRVAPWCFGASLMKTKWGISAKMVAYELWSTKSMFWNPLPLTFPFERWNPSGHSFWPAKNENLDLPPHKTKNQVFQSCLKMIHMINWT